MFEPRNARVKGSRKEGVMEIDDGHPECVGDWISPCAGEIVEVPDEYILKEYNRVVLVPLCKKHRENRSEGA
jgi:hypothetical protein